MSKRKPNRKRRAHPPVHLVIVCSCPDCGHYITLRATASEVGRHADQAEAISYANALAETVEKRNPDCALLVLLATPGGIFRTLDRACDAPPS